MNKVIEASANWKGKLQKPYVIAIAAILICCGALLWFFYSRSISIEPASIEKMAYPLPEKPSIAVLPFDNLSDEFQNIPINLIQNLVYGDLGFKVQTRSMYLYRKIPIGFTERYLIPVVYPAGLNRSAQVALGVGVLLINVVFHGLLAARRTQTSRDA